jgi:ectoine hydroxylase-related dioxygenase (phytanoyl-CoA dioxygenase family)
MGTPMNSISKIASAAYEVDREDFLANGYTVIRDALDVAILEQVNREIDALFAIQLRELGLPVDPGASRQALHANACRLLQADVPRYINTARLTQMLPTASQLVVSDAILDIARRLGVAFPVVSTRTANHIISDLLKIPDGYHKSPPHQDWRSMQGSLDSIVLWIPTTPVTLGGHPLEVVPKSHLLGLLDTVEHIQTPTVSDPRIGDDSFVGLELEPGDLVAFSTFLVHRTGDQGDGQLRIAYSCRFNNAEEPTYVAHGYNTPYKYSYRTDLMTPDFPTPDDLRKIFPAVEAAS